MRLREIGELNIIRIIERTLGASRLMAVGFGDDLAAVKMRGGVVVLAKTDMLVGSTDIPPGMTMRQAGRKAIVACVSDFAAKGVRPVAGVVALGLPSEMSVKDLRGIALGLRDGSREYSVPIIGGDTNASKDLTLCPALFAVKGRRQLVLRSGARIGDIVAVTGRFGSTSAGLKALLEKRKRPRELPRVIYNAIFNPSADLDIGLTLSTSGCVTAAIDSSDGLALSLHQLAMASGVGIELNQVPVEGTAERFARECGYDAKQLAFYGGEEYRLVVAVRRKRLEAARRLTGGRLIPIGVVTRRSEGVRLRTSHLDMRLELKGWEHFRPW